MKKTNTVIDILKTKEVEYINLDEYVHSGAGDVYNIRVEGNAVEDLGVFDGDLLVVDREKKPETGNLVIFQVGDDVMLYAYKRVKAEIYLAYSEGKKVMQSKHEPVAAPKGEHIVWATVTHIVRNVARKEKTNVEN
jgi:SOS-response transcriptional repressor LexA